LLRFITDWQLLFLSAAWLNALRDSSFTADLGGYFSGSFSPVAENF
jgi:hypothetical protein